MGLNLKNPLIAASSGFTENVPDMVELEKAGVSAIVLKSVFEEEILLDYNARSAKMKSEGFLYPETLGFYEDIDVLGSLTDKYIDLVKQAKSHLGIPVIPSINCLSPGKWTDFTHKLQSAGADAIELNIFMLPSDNQRTDDELSQVYSDIVKEVKAKIQIPVAVKIGMYSNNLVRLASGLESAGANGLVLFNRHYNPDIDIEAMEVTSGFVLSNPGDLSVPLRWTALLSGRTGMDVAATTGVHDAKAIIKLLLAGASVVQVASAFYREGPEIATEFLSGLEKWMDQKGFAGINDFRGLMSYTKVDNPAAYERVQFMKYFRGYKK
jgi:dihydroorotate dehydrogenase (fumarate)